MSFGVQSAFAESNSPKATVKNNVVTFSNLDQLKANEKLAIAVVDSNGDPATITIESVDNSISRVAKSSNSWKVSYHDILYSYDSGGHLMDTTKSYHQAVGG